MRRALLILGPTASGKSALALALARATNAVVVNADSMQVYADLPILTARPTAEEEKLAPHRLFGVADGAERFSTGRWLALAAREIAAAREAGRPVILVGGTGLYFKALTEGLAAAPPSDPAIAQALMAEMADDGAPALHRQLAEEDPAAAAALSPRDGPRIIRALAVIRATGRPLRSWFADQPPPVLGPGEWVGVALWPERTALYATIERRFGAMLEAGALDEAARFLNRGLDETLPLMKAHGLPWIAAHLRGKMSLEEARDLSVRDTRRYAKRQFTWMAGQAAAWTRVTMESAAERIAAVERLLGED